MEQGRETGVRAQAENSDHSDQFPGSGENDASIDRISGFVVEDGVRTLRDSGAFPNRRVSKKRRIPGHFPMSGNCEEREAIGGRV